VREETNGRFRAGEAQLVERMSETVLEDNVGLEIEKGRDSVSPEIDRNLPAHDGGPRAATELIAVGHLMASCLEQRHKVPEITLRSASDAGVDPCDGDSHSTPSVARSRFTRAMARRVQFAWSSGATSRLRALERPLGPGLLSCENR
jgi:hypothetical protein